MKKLLCLLFAIAICFTLVAFAKSNNKVELDEEAYTEAEAVITEAVIKETDLADLANLCENEPVVMIFERSPYFIDPLSCYIS
jgi:hypothetical protein